MHFPTAATVFALTLTATSLLSPTLALPTEKRSGLCTTKPSIVKYISKTGHLSRIVNAGSKYASSIPLGHDEFIIKSDPDSCNTTANGETDTVRTALKFDLPTSATGCRLQVSNLPKRIFAKGGQIDTDVYRVKDVRSSSEWTCQPSPLFPEQPGKVAQWNWEGSETNLWAGDCEESLMFLFKYGNWQTEGGVMHFQQAMNDNDSDDGFKIVYDC